MRSHIIATFHMYFIDFVFFLIFLITRFWSLFGFIFVANEHLVSIATKKGLNFIYFHANFIKQQRYVFFYDRLNFQNILRDYPSYFLNLRLNEYN